MNGPSEVLDLGRRTRVVTPAQRRALAVRDGGCVFPGCDRPPPWTDAHHLVHWLDNGPSNLDNLVLLCRRHHVLCHEGRWQLQRGPDGTVTAERPRPRPRGPDLTLRGLSFSRKPHVAPGRATRLAHVIVQIYGITTADDTAAVVALAPDHVGLVLDEGIETWDSVDLATARAIVEELRGHTRIVALSLSTKSDRIRRTVDEVGAEIVHLARAVGEIDPDRLVKLRDQLAPVQVMTTIPVHGPEAVDAARAYAGCSDWLLLDSAHPETGVVGATGQVHDWTHSAAIVHTVDIPVVLAGGLGPENVRAAIQQVRPAGVDSETHTSLPDDRRRKDLDAVRQFIEIARTGVPGGSTSP